MQIAELQRADGSFAVARRGAARSPLQIDDGTASLALHALLLDVLSNSGAEAQTVCARLAEWLARQLRAQQVEGAFAVANPYATFHALGAVQAYDSELIDQSLLAAAVHHLITHEIEPGGPYYQIDASGAQHVELITNIAIARFVSLVANPLPKLNAHIADLLQRGATSDYYTTPWPVAFLLRQTYGTTLSAGNADYVRTHLHDADFTAPEIKTRHGTYTLAALQLAVSNCSPRVERGASMLISTSEKPADKGYARIVATAKTVADQAGPLVSSTLHAALDQLVAADQNQEIGPLATRFAHAHTPRSIIPTKVLRQLGVANLYAWIAYTIYDDFLDDEGRPHMLPAANVAMRAAANAFRQALPDCTGFETLVADVFTAMDAANAWEIAHCRFPVDQGRIQIGRLPDYGDLRFLYQRSLSHSLPIVGVLLASGGRLTDPGVCATQRAFREYLTIRQLSDDLRDWQDDLAAGHISYVVAELLRGAQISAGSRQLQMILPRLEAYFWHEGLTSLSRVIQQRAQRARRLLQGSGIVQDQNVLTELIGIIEQSTERTLADKQRVEQFAAAYAHTATQQP